MASPTVEGTTGVLTEIASSTTKVIPYPTSVSGGIQAGDLLVVILGSDAAVTVTSIGTWTQLDFGNSGGTVSCVGGAWFKWAAGGETGNNSEIVLSSERAAARMYCIRSADTGTNPEEATATTGDSTNPDPPSSTPSWGSDTNLYLAWCVIDAVDPSAGPTSYTNGPGFEHNIATSGAAVGVAFRATTNSPENPGVFTAATDQWRAGTIAIRPITAGGPTTYNKSGFATTGAVLLGADVFESTETGTVAADTLLAGPSEYTPAPGPPIALPIVVRSGQVWRRS